ncbi:hypothetical protein JW935_29145 [candidate division KSB1 bacterium]|nr:hypothetical protein [candidate division KSB1 bacterium]
MYSWRNKALKRGFFIDIESLENLVAQQFELMDRLIISSQIETISTGKIAGFIYQIDFIKPPGCTFTEPHPF